MLLAHPEDDDSLLGRILTAMPSPGEPLGPISAPNPCADKLSPRQDSTVSRSFQDALALPASKGTRALLREFGFPHDWVSATHLVYRFRASRQALQNDNPDYLECCRQKGCGLAYVGMLVWGEGEFVSAREPSDGTRPNFVFEADDGEISLSAIHRRRVRGNLAALVRRSPGAPGDSPLGLRSGTTSETAAETATLIARPSACLDRRAAVATDAFGRKVLSLGGRVVTENEFVRDYRTVTGSKELDPIDTMRTRDLRTVAFVLLSVSAAALATGVIVGDCPHHAAEERGPCYSKSWESVAYSYGRPLGVAGIAVSGVMLLTAYASKDGSPSSHYLTSAQMDTYVAKYNRALRRKAGSAVQSPGQGMPSQESSPNRSEVRCSKPLTVEAF